ncbi:bifunctional nicotinamidase/pyrazinamidase [Xanthobacter autotrophicus]|uniref:bifunctional nicotinamidase/pyrazinamidase n=1 Tax=Xanthobacter TaxID=279 RepID=UPI0024AB94F8|nr:bifunctional nicotinamidase/pyrazinamidase [Xanthobacter autotrophicus]MDI4666380.1 bifunctional nicotinamidase/pyrazinamidase [Xanthobacter autotrophicus]
MPATASAADPRARAVLVAVDLQVDFLPGGRLAVPGGHEVVPLANAVAQGFRNVVLTQDWHPADHVSFASSHAGRAPFDEIDLPYGRQILWPDHCVQDTDGARLSAVLDIPHAQLIIRKGHHRAIDSYSTFYEADRTTPTGLSGYLRDRHIDTVYLIGLATDFCVSWSAVDAARHGFTTYVLEDACRALDVDGSLAKAHADMAAAGVRRIRTADVMD